jgi:hypothetical protein
MKKHRAPRDVALVGPREPRVSSSAGKSWPAANFDFSLRPTDTAPCRAALRGSDMGKST